MSQRYGENSPSSDIPDFSEILSWRNIPPRYLTVNEITEIFEANYEVPPELYSDLREDLKYENILRWMDKTGLSRRMNRNDMTTYWSNGLLSDIIWRKLFLKDFSKPFHPIETEILMQTLKRKGYTVKNHKDALKPVWEGKLCIRKMMRIAKSNLSFEKEGRGLMSNSNLRSDAKGKWSCITGQIANFPIDDDSNRNNMIEGARSCTLSGSNRVFYNHLHSNMYLIGSWYSLYVARLIYERNLTRFPIDGEIITEMADYIIRRYPTSHCTWRRGHILHIVDIHKHGVHRW